MQIYEDKAHGVRTRVKKSSRAINVFSRQRIEFARSVASIQPMAKSPTSTFGNVEPGVIDCVASVVSRRWQASLGPTVSAVRTECESLVQSTTNERELLSMQLNSKRRLKALFAARA